MSDDNPFSEAQFKTLKYHPGFPGRSRSRAAGVDFPAAFPPTAADNSPNFDFS